MSELLESLEQPEAPDNLDRLEHQGQVVLRAKEELPDSRASRASLDLRVNRGLKDQPGQLAHKVQPGVLDSLDPREFKVHLACLEPREPVVKLVLPEPLVSLETAVLRAAVDSRAPLDRREARDSRDSLVSLELRGPLEQRDRRVKLDLRDQQVVRVLPVQSAPRAM